MFLKILLTAYCGAALFAAGVTAADSLVSFPFLGFLAFLLALGLIPAIAFETARRPTRPRLIQAGIVVVLGAGALFLSPKLIPASRQLYFRQRRSDFQQVADITIRSPIRQFWDASDTWASLNGRFVSLVDTLPSPIGVLRGGPILFLDSVLNQDHISPQLFADLRSRLRSLDATLLIVDSDVVRIGGRDAGFVYIPPGAKERSVGDDLGFPGNSPRLVAKLAERWYYAYW